MPRNTNFTKNSNGNKKHVIQSANGFRRSPDLKQEKEKLSMLFLKTVQEYQEKAKLLDSLNDQRITQANKIEMIESDSKIYLEIIMKYHKSFQTLLNTHIDNAIAIHNRTHDGDDNNKDNYNDLHQNAGPRNQSHNFTSAKYSNTTTHRNYENVDKKTGNYNYNNAGNNHNVNRVANGNYSTNDNNRRDNSKKRFSSNDNNNNVNNGMIDSNNVHNNTFLYASPQSEMSQSQTSSSSKSNNIVPPSPFDDDDMDDFDIYED